MYESTRNRDLSVSASRAIVSGIAPDGGLYVPKGFEPLDLSKIPTTIPYPELTRVVLDHFLDDFTLNDLDFVDSAYQDFTPIVGFQRLQDFDLLSLAHGPTFAFKDMALVLFSELLDQAKNKCGIEGKTVVLTATSGDTGSATLNGFKDDPLTRVVVFYPFQGVSAFQEKQMLSLTDSRHRAIAVKGDFDTCQRLVKRAFIEMEQDDIVLSSANSINIARIIPQVVYYIYAYLRLVASGRIRFGEHIDVTVPTGNFGNTLSAYYAKMSGLPIDRLIVASNENHVLTDFFHSGIYQSDRRIIRTISPAMDILISSNLERLIYLKSNRNDALIRSLMDELTHNGSYALPDRERQTYGDFYAGYATEEKTLQTIYRAFVDEGVLIDPHTAVAASVYEQYLQEGGTRKPTVIVQTADPFKFSDAMCKAFDRNASFSDPSESVTALERRTGLRTHDRIKKLVRERHVPTIWSAEEALERLWEWIG
ncbi:MAG: threonine synthase [Acholeplasmataceae bacterium]